MDETNRVGAIVSSLAIMFIALLVILLTWGAPQDSIDSLADLANYLDDHSDAPTQLLITFGALIVFLLGLVVIIFEIMPPQTGSVKVSKVGSGDVRIETSEIERRLQEELRSVPRLRAAEARVVSRNSRADVRLRLSVDSEADVAVTASAAVERARALVEERLGLELESPPRADVRFTDEAKHNRAAASQPTPSWQPTPPPVSKTEQAASSSGVHEATPATTQEDRPTGA